MIYDLDWDKDERLGEWHGVVRQAQDLPPVLQAVVALDAWNELAEHAEQAIVRADPTQGRHYDRRPSGEYQSWPQYHSDGSASPSRSGNAAAGNAHGLLAVTGLGLKEHHRLALARTMMKRKLFGRRTSSKLPGMIELVMAKPLVSAGMIAEELGVTPRAALRIVESWACGR
jgi:hypothetical protein